MPTVYYNWVNTVASFQVSEDGLEAQNGATIASINGGSSYFNAWDSGFGVEARIITNFGQAGSYFFINDEDFTLDADLSVAQLSGGNIIVTYTDTYNDPGGDIYMSVFNSGASLLFSGPIDNSAYDDADSDIATLADGGFVVTWTRNYGGGDLDVLASIHNANGTIRNSVDVESNFDSASRSQVIGLNNGNWVAVYEKEPAAGGDTEVYFHIYNALGASVRVATLIDTIGSINEDVQIVALQDGGFAVAYADDGWGLSGTEITLRIFNADGSTRSEYIRVNTDTTGDEYNPTLTTLSNGYIIVGWNDDQTLTYQAFTPTGVPVGANWDAATLVYEAEIAGLAGGLIANNYTSLALPGQVYTSIRSSVDALVRTTIGDGTNEILVGDLLSDVIDGQGGDDILTGGLGRDTLTGGGGSDTFRDAAASLSGDTIADFSTGDRIVLGDASLAGFSFSLSGNTLTFAGGSVTLTGFSGQLVASAAAEGGVQLTVRPDAANDFNGDGRSDILWRHDSGLVTNWLGNPSGGFASNHSNVSTNVATSWQVAGAGDFNGDGKDDILWRHDSGLITDWLGTANGSFADNYANAAANVATSWQVAGVGDFDGDGKDDILWRHDSGLISDWLGEADGGFGDNFANASANVATSWKVIGTGDFNGDGKDDILWRHDGGLITNWLGEADGGFADNYANAAANVATSWHIAGIGDFNGDGKDDILWRHDSGLLTNWLGEADGGFAPNNGNAWANVDTSWQVAATGDYNGDGRDDILWRHSSGLVTDWLGTAGGGFAANNANAQAAVSNEWAVQSIDLHGM